MFIVDDDSAMRESLAFLLGSIDLPVASFASAQTFLAQYREPRPGCLLTDVRMPGMSGLALLDELRARGWGLPVILMTAHADVPMAVRAMRAGAFDFIEKPFNDQDLLERIQSALDSDAARRATEHHQIELAARLERLSPREREVLELIVEGRLNKQIAGHLGLSIKTVELHRARVMEKMGANNLAELVRRVLTVRAGG